MCGVILREIGVEDLQAEYEKIEDEVDSLKIGFKKEKVKKANNLTREKKVNSILIEKSKKKV